MTGTLIGVVHRNGFPLRLIVPDRDEELDDPAHVAGPGEAMVRLVAQDHPLTDNASLAAAVAAATGMVPEVDASSK